MVDGKEEKRYASILKHTLTFSPDGKRVAYAAREGDKWFVIEETTDGDRFKNIITFRPDSNFGEVRNDDAKDVISSIGNQYDGIIEGSLIFSPDSKHLVYGVSNSDGQFVVMDGKDGKRYDSIIFIYDGGGIIFDSPDLFHYLARKNGGIYLVEEIAAIYI